MTVNTIQEGHQTIADAVVEKRTKARRQGYSQEMTKATRTPATAYNIEEWMWGLEEDAPKVEARNGDIGDCRLE